MLTGHAVQIQKAGLPFNRCKEKLQPNSSDNVNTPQRWDRGAGPLHVALVHWPPLSTTTVGLPAQSDKWITKRVNVLSPVPATTMNCTNTTSADLPLILGVTNEKWDFILTKVPRESTKATFKEVPLAVDDIWNNEWTKGPGTEHRHTGAGASSKPFHTELH